MKVYLDSVGCRLNQSEIEQYAIQFRAAGHEVVGSAAEADLVVVNTCAVTAQAASDSRQKARQAAKVLGEHGEIVLTGCWSSIDQAGARALPRVSRVVSNQEKDRLPADILGEDVFDLEPVARLPMPGLHRRTRAFLKVQDGCDNHCTFCVTRIARGAGRSRPVDAVLADLNTAVAGESKEVVLTGVHLGSWGQDFNPPARLEDLVRRVLAADGYARLRLSSLEPWDLERDFFELWANPRLCRHMHLPLQSGCDSTLRRMARKTTPETFAALVSDARSACADMAVTTDVIVGFPGESEAEFADSLAFVQAMNFAGGHVFNYSIRPGTAAARMPGQVALEVRKERSRKMREVLQAAEMAYYQRFLESTAAVLWESTSTLGPDGWHLHGLSDNYLRVTAVSPQRLWNEISQVRLNGLIGDEISGVITGS
jgi:threonylcarbamoyladenosine tRNA methylthiotransferase MtaB